MVITHVGWILVASICHLVLVMNQHKEQQDASLKELNLYFNIMNVKLCLLNQEIGIQLFYQIIQHRFHFIQPIARSCSPNTYEPTLGARAI